MSKLGTLVSDFKDEALKVKNFIEEAAADAPKIIEDVAEDTAKILPVLEAFLPGAGTAVTLGDTLLNLAAQAVEDAGSAAAANGLSVVLDSTVVKDIEAVIASAKKLKV